MELAPNPAKDQITISIKGTDLPHQIEIADVNGRIIKTQSQPALFNVPVDVSQLSPGIYFARLIFEKGMISKRFIKVGE